MCVVFTGSPCDMGLQHPRGRLAPVLVWCGKQMLRWYRVVMLRDSFGCSLLFSWGGVDVDVIVVNVV